MFSNIKQYDKNHVRQVAYACTREQISDEWLEEIEESIRIVKYYIKEVYQAN